MLIAVLVAALATVIGSPAAHADVGTPPDQGHADGGGAVSYRAEVVAPAPRHAVALRAAYAHRHDVETSDTPQPRRLRVARHRGVLWALAAFTRADGAVVTERFTWRRGAGWRDLGVTRAACPAVPPEVRSAWRLPSACQTS